MRNLFFRISVLTSLKLENYVPPNPSVDVFAVMAIPAVVPSMITHLTYHLPHASPTRLFTRILEHNKWSFKVDR